MAAVARRHGLTVEEGRFEEWDPAGRRFDLVVSAQAWHWIDPVAGARQAAAGPANEGGRVGVFWNRGQPPDDAARRPRRRLPADGSRDSGEGYALPSAARTGRPTRTASGPRTPSGRPAASSTWRSGCSSHTVEYTTAQWLDLLPTHSDHRTLPAGQLAAVLAAVGEADRRAPAGRFEMRYQTWLAEARGSTRPDHGADSRPG